jgi:hypothetical protein
VVCMEVPVQNRQEADREELYSIYGISEVDSGLGERLVTVANRTGLANYREFQPEKMGQLIYSQVQRCEEMVSLELSQISGCL